MKKTQKNLLGLFGLFLVIVTTVFAAYLPNPAASAASSVTDTVTVRVISPVGDITINGIESGSIFVDSEHDVNVDYASVNHLTIVLKHVDKDGIEHEYILADETYDSSSGDYPINLNLHNYGFGEYTITARGEGIDSSDYDEDIITFTYIPVTGVVESDEETGKAYLNLNYEPDSGSAEDEGKVASLEINIYDHDGNLLTPLSPISVDAPDDKVLLPLEDYALSSGDYVVEIKAFGRDGELLYREYVTDFDYDNGTVIPDSGEVEPAVPDTGGLLEGLNISKSDYLITGLLVFSVVGIGGTIAILKKDKKSSKRR